MATDLTAAKEERDFQELWKRIGGNPEINWDAEVVAVRVAGPYRLWLKFNDGLEKTVNVEPLLRGPVFEPLRDPEFFAQAKLEGITVAWPNGSDIAPETLYGLPEAE